VSFSRLQAPHAKDENARSPELTKDLHNPARLFKFPQMDFEMAIWEMTSLLLAPKKVFRSIYYHKQTKNTYHRADPSFTYLLSFFMLLTGIAWGIASTPSFASTLRLTLLFVFVHFLLVSLLVATAAFFLVGRLLGPGIQGLPGRRRQAGLFRRPADGEGDVLEFGYCFDVSVVVAFPRRGVGLTGAWNRSPYGPSSPSGCFSTLSSLSSGRSYRATIGYPSSSAIHSTWSRWAIILSYAF